VRIRYLSPHLDDAALSCGGSIARATAAGEEVEVLTIFAGDEPEEAATPLVARLYELWKLPLGGVMRARRAEDAAACARLGARATWWTELEAIHRRHPASGAPLYPDLRALFGEPAPVERARRVDELAGRLRALPAADRVVSPLGVGGHADHRLLRRAAEAAFGAGLRYYEEFPYALWKRFAVLRAIGLGRRFRSERLPLAEADVVARIEAIGCYASQLQPLFRSRERLESMVRRHVRRAGGERLWRRTATADGRAETG
jgi:LmbE family N-acetylglucosaminyl deacetylase